MLEVRDQGSNNKIDICSNVFNESTGLITVSGCNNVLSISAGSSLTHANVFVGGGGHVVIDGARIAACEIYCAAGARIAIGRGCAFTWRAQILAHEAGCIEIGPECLFSTETLITLSDMHTIIDIESGLRLNDPRSVIIGAHVWIGFRALVLKGARIGDGSVIGAGSIVTGEIPGSCVATGNPARVVRNSIAWKPELI